VFTVVLHNSVGDVMLASYTASVTQIDVVFKSCTECKILVDGIRESLHVQAHQVIRIFPIFQ